jgi:hypothetical protein
MPVYLLLQVIARDVKPRFVTFVYTVRLLSFRTDCVERILRTPSAGHPQKQVGARIDTLCA